MPYRFMICWRRFSLRLPFCNARLNFRPSLLRRPYAKASLRRAPPLMLHHPVIISREMRVDFSMIKRAGAIFSDDRHACKRSANAAFEAAAISLLTPPAHTRFSPSQNYFAGEPLRRKKGLAPRVSSIFGILFILYSIS